MDPHQLECLKVPDEHKYLTAEPDVLRAPEPLSSATLFSRSILRKVILSPWTTVRQGVEQAVSHLHALKLGNNDISPFNVMLGDNNEPVLIDLDSCEHEGGLLGFKAGTEDWADRTARTASFANGF